MGHKETRTLRVVLSFILLLLLCVNLIGCQKFESDSEKLLQKYIDECVFIEIEGQDNVYIFCYEYINIDYENGKFYSIYSNLSHNISIRVDNYSNLNNYNGVYSGRIKVVIDKNTNIKKDILKVSEK